MSTPDERLEYLRGEIRAERISYGELAELQDLAEWIDPGDVELLQWAGVEEAAATYKIVRFRFKGENEVIDTGLTLDEAQAHCQREDTHGDGWFDGYEAE